VDQWKGLSVNNEQETELDFFASLNKP